MPEQTGSAPIVGPVMANGVPHEFVAGGGVGVTCAFEIQATVEPPGAGTENVGGLMVYV